ncbi:MAG: hypothetical protein SPJ34_00330, partial [Candidatus Ornithospirochaeta sp.]|nr:hypothetical protein [Candidatus Ornithospirochaeta sp.]
VAVGRTLGSVEPVVENGTDWIRLSWDEVENATRYVVNVYNSPSDSVAIGTVTVMAGRDLEYMLNADSDVVAGNTSVQNPLSKPYSFSVTPYCREERADKSVEKRVEGHWILPPTGITATKAEFRDMIRVSWDAVDGMSGYNVYIWDSAALSWDFFQYTSSTSLEIPIDSSVRSSFRFSVASLDESGREGIMQSAFDGDENVGVTLLDPGRIEGVQIDGGEILKIQFDDNEYATGYCIKPEGQDAILIDKSMISSSGKTYGESGYAELVNGRVTVFIDRPAIIYNTLLTVSIESYRASNIESNNTSYGYTLKLIPVSIKPNEIVNLVNPILMNLISKANDKFGGDWWTSTSAVSYSEPGMHAQSCSSKAWYDSGNQVNGYISFDEMTNGTVKASGSFGLRSDSGYESLAGYLGVDPLEYIKDGPDGQNLVSVTLPYALGNATIKYDNVYIGLDSSKFNTGNYQVTYNGVSYVVPANTVSVNPF